MARSRPLLWASHPHDLDRIRNRERAARHLGMQPLDHAAIERDHALVLVLGQIEGRDDLACLRDLLGAGAKAALSAAIWLG